MIKKLIKVGTVSLMACLALLTQVQAGGLITTNLTAGTNVVWVGRVSAYQIDVTSAAANVVKVYDTGSNALTYVTAAYTGSSNITMNITNVYTNAIYEYPGVGTNIYKMTNISLNVNIRTNYTVGATSNNCQAVVSLFCPAGLTTTISGVDMNFLYGIVVTNTGAASISIYTR